SGETLDIRAAGGEGADVQVAGHGGQANREFKIEKVGDSGFWTISARHSGLSLDVRNAGAVMATVQTAGRGGQANREWLLIPVKSVASKAYARPSGPALIAPATPGDVLGKSGFHYSVNAPVSARETCTLDVVLRDVGFNKVDRDGWRFSAEVTAEV